ncbi:MAG: Fic family protein [Candidatus Pacebacteria bacterium]|nr:Fic family protein [Candidatus Paceibacterota bacterium]
MKLPEKSPNWKNVIRNKREIITQILSDQDFYKTVLEFNKKYLYWSELKYRVKDKDKREATWGVMKLLRDGKEETCKFKKIKLKYNILSDISRKLHYFDKQLAGNIISQTNALGLEEKYIISSLMEEAIASSMIEGATTTRKIAKEMLQEKRKPKNKSEKMILNNYNAIEAITARKNEKLTPKFLLEIQKIVTRDTLNDKADEGKYRDNNEIIITDELEFEKIAHMPPDYLNIPELITELCRFANSEDDEFVHPIIKGIIIHFLIGYIHPFNDGNGRTARTIFYWFMLSRGYWLFEYMAVSRRIIRSRKDYDLAYLYTEYDELDLTYFIKYNISCINDALKDLFKYVQEKQKEQQETRSIIDKNLGLNRRQIDIVRKFRQEPNKLFTIKEIKESYGVAYATARADLFLLTKKKVIKKENAGNEFIFMFNK